VVPPVACSDCEYAAPIAPLGSGEAVVTVKMDVMLMLNDWVAVSFVAGSVT
jgi:hypothetical protein